ncbi:MAG: aminopeptidase P family protein [Prevotellaceae bacterium]|nr:aminopeptidase P family protein [Prevotellaceae bacterium]
MRHLNIKQRIEALRNMMREEGLQAIILPSTDPHLSEYVSPHWKSRQWISGFTGSAGTVVVTLKKAGLWTDSRYFLQAESQLQGSGITLYKEKLPETPTFVEFLAKELPKGSSVGIDSEIVSFRAGSELYAELDERGITLASLTDPLKAIWEDRPPLPDAPVYIHDMDYAGESAVHKIKRIREALKKQKAKATALTALDEIAWTLNLRGSDVHCNPVIISYLLITENEIHFFVNPRKITETVDKCLREINVTVHPYEEAMDYLSYHTFKRVLLDPERTNSAIWRMIGFENIIAGPSPVARFKAVRNPVEISGTQAAMVRDGVALVKFHMWLEQAVQQGAVTEIDIDQKLYELRAEQELFMGKSFDTIAGYKEHGAIVHYAATPETDKRLERKGYVLIDSGAQYLDGTTDITRTIALGELSDEEKLDFTLVLRGHINLAMAHFPEGTCGIQLDILARDAMWKQHRNYLHGTGHGVGHFLSVHEGPQTVRMEGNMVPLCAGMVLSDEPGLYQAGSHGVRTENLMLVVPAGEGMFGSYLRFETLTLCPIDTRGILKEMLTKEERRWLNDYHRTVYKKLSPRLNKEEQAWLKEKTKSI